MESSSSQGFAQLHERVQRWIWQQQWSQLRDIQAQSIAPILTGKTDLIIAAATASGKTEAAFLPIFSKLLRDRALAESNAEFPGIQVLYVSPLKALINDQSDRLSDLGDRLEIPIHAWHGDIDSAKKQRALAYPSGVLLITPEALEAMFIRRGHELARLYSALQYVVIDELHSFIGTERGQQLRSLLYRLEFVLDRKLPHIGLSATLGEMNLAKAYLRRDQPERVQLVESNQQGHEIKLQIRAYRKLALEISIDSEPDYDRSPEYSANEVEIATHLFKVLRGDKNLIFLNRRQEVERYTDLLDRMCTARQVPQEFLPHHGSLSKDLRAAAEAALKDPDKPANVLCTSTLELGIDVGAVNSIAQIGPPLTVASTRQRLGRSGRRATDAAILRLYVTEPEITAASSPESALHPGLVQSIAIINLLLQGWYEPPIVHHLHLSTLIQQLLSLIAQCSGIRPDRAWQILCKNGAFATVDATTYKQLLRCLGQQDLIQQTQNGLLLLGEKGERLVNHYSFYTAFQSSEEYRLTTTGKMLGTLPIDSPLLEGMFLIFAGKRWQVVTIDRDQRVVDVIPATAGRVPYFGGTAGIVHDRIRQEMLRIYTTEEMPPCLNPTARTLLREARTYFAAFELAQQPWLTQDWQTWLFPWAGSLVMNTLFVMLQARGLRVEQSAIALIFNDTPLPILKQHLRELATTEPPDAIALAATVNNKMNDKHDLFLTEELLCKNYASSYLDVMGAWRSLQKISSGF